MLAILTSRSGQVVAREEIRQQVWGEETYVDFEHSLNQCIKQIRTALNDDSSKPLYIETLPRKGYRFLAPVTSKTVATPPAKVTASISGIQSRAVLPRVSATSDNIVVASVQSMAQAAAPAPENPILAPDPLTAHVNRDVAAGEKKDPESSTHGQARRFIGLLALPVLAAIGIAFYWHSQKASALMEKDTVVLADFTNSTGESVFDDTLKQALRIQLEQSPFLNLVDDRKVNATLKLTGRSPSDRLTPDVTRDVCQRVGSKAMLTGSIAELGSQYVIGVKAVNCNSGDLLAEAQERAKSKEDVLKALDRAAISVRRRLGESLRSVNNFATPVEEATTPSLEALQAYSLARKIEFANGSVAALPFYERAVELDPEFARAYVGLSVHYANLNQAGRAAENALKAYDLRGKVGDRERFAIEAIYRMVATGELDKAVQVYELWQQIYPRDFLPYGNLSFIYLELGSWEEALNQGLEAIRLAPNSNIGYINAGTAYLGLNRLQEAEATFKQAEGRGLGSEGLLDERYQLAFLKGDGAWMARLVADGIGKAGIEDSVLAMQADTQAWYGKLKSARELTGRATDSAKQNDASETVAAYRAAAALREVESGNWERGRAEADAAVKLAPDRDVQGMAALALARSGDTVKAEKLAAELNHSFPSDTLVQKYWLPTVRAAVALEHNAPDNAIEALKASSAIELGQPAKTRVFLAPAYLRGEAYLMLRDGNSAAAEFRKFIDYRGVVGNGPLGAVARLGLARAYAIEAETEPTARDKARAAYQDFMTLWKDADPDIPIYRRAKTEYKKLQATS